MATGKRGEDLLFSTSTGSPVSRNAFRTRVWLPAIERSGIRQRVRFHDRALAAFETVRHRRS
jgi:hypothetical protein